MKKIATVFGAARMDEYCSDFIAAYEIGKMLASKNYTVHHGGYNLGVMKATALGVKELDGEQYGIQCADIGFYSNPNCPSIIETENLFDRLKRLIEDSEIFIVYPGGIGTLTEFSLVLDYYRKSDKKPQIYFIGNHWKNLFSMDFIPNTCKKMITFVSHYSQLELLL